MAPRASIIECKLTFLPLYVEDLVEPEELRLPDGCWDEVSSVAPDCGGLGASAPGILRGVERCEFDIACMALIPSNTQKARAHQYKASKSDLASVEKR